MLHDAFPVANSVHSGLSAYMRMIFKDQFIHGVGWLSYAMKPKCWMKKDKGPGTARLVSNAANLCFCAALFLSQLGKLCKVMQCK